MKLIDADDLMEVINKSIDAATKVGIVVDGQFLWSLIRYAINNASAINLIKCKECKHRPIKEDADGKNYGFNLIKPNNEDTCCPCLISDGWYSWMPKDDFYCGYGEENNE